MLNEGTKIGLALTLNPISTVEGYFHLENGEYEHFNVGSSASIFF